ncbi:phospholipid-transporting ATPase 1 isoform X2 [Gossypium raimondii]|uniref:phospholipid-transporting ATPase 1 isoform X2 n=1 Tax=Gossypium raimondii TaxID=29730 RepID=UPI00227A8AFC|nr:phospholipid-transporting ATPase 1 isoform X2 [Gossypium raimondii]
MSVILGFPNQSVKVFVKGADTTMFSVIDRSLNTIIIRATEGHLHSYSSIGLRTLVIGMRELSTSEFEEWHSAFEVASTALMASTSKLNINLVEDAVVQALGRHRRLGLLHQSVSGLVNVFLEKSQSVWRGR